MPIENPLLFICDIQTAFEKAIYNFPHVVYIAKKLLRASEILDIPTYVTTQNRARLGNTVPELDVGNVKTVRGDWDKTLFSMMVPELRAAVEEYKKEKGKVTVAIVGIESHVCVLQTALDLLRMGVDVYIVADGVSSSNAAEVPIARERMRQAGAVIGTSESFLYEVMGDSSIKEFRDMIKLVKDTKEGTSGALEALARL